MVRITALKENGGKAKKPSAALAATKKGPNVPKAKNSINTNKKGGTAKRQPAAAVVASGSRPSISDPSVVRLRKRAGAVGLNKEIPNRLRRIIVALTMDIARPLTVIAEHQHAKTITSSHLDMILPNLGLSTRKVLVLESTKKRSKKDEEKKASVAAPSSTKKAAQSQPVKNKAKAVKA